MVRRAYIFWTSCVESVGSLINEMQAESTDATYATMLAHCEGLLEKAEELGYERRSSSGHGLTLKNDWSISYHKSKYCGFPCYYFVWSHIEYIWVRRQDQNAVADCEQYARENERGRTSLLARHNPLLPDAYSRETQPCSLIKPIGCGMPFDDRSGVHVTDDWGLALRYAAFKAARSGSIAVILTYDMHGLKLEPDFDAMVEREYTGIGELSYYVEEFDILYDPENPDFLRLANILDDCCGGDQESDGPPWSVQSELHRLSKTPIELVVADHLRGNEAYTALQAFVTGKLPLEYFAESIHQWRTFEEVGDERLVRVEVVKPFYDTVDLRDEDQDEDECPMRLTPEDLDYIPGAVEKEVLLKQPGHRYNAKDYYHGTDLIRAKQILAGIHGSDTGLINPWAPCVQPED